jgi:uncharacterized damage-inducible protein DinB
MLAFYRRLFHYDAWANRAAIGSLRVGQPAARAVRVMAHIAAAERLWYDRLLGQKQSLPVWPELTLDQSQELVDRMAAEWRAYLDQLDPAGLDQVIEYTNTKGERWSNSVGDVLTHVVMHSAYHRGQIATMVRERGGEPAYTDFIEAVRRGMVRDGEGR